MKLCQIQESFVEKALMIRNFESDYIPSLLCTHSLDLWTDFRKMDDGTLLGAVEEVDRLPASPQTQEALCPSFTLDSQRWIRNLLAAVRALVDLGLLAQSNLTTARKLFPFDG